MKRVEPVENFVKQVFGYREIVETFPHPSYAECVFVVFQPFTEKFLISFLDNPLDFLRIVAMLVM